MTELLKGSVIYGAVTIISRVAAIIIIPILTHLMSPGEYGVLSTMLTVVQLANFIVTLEVAQAVTYFFTNKNRTDSQHFPSAALWFSIASYFFIFLIANLFSSVPAIELAGAAINFAIIKDSIFLLAANGIFLLVQNQLRLEFKTLQYALLSLGYVVLTTVGAYLGAKYYGSPASGVLIGQASGAAIIDVLAISILWKRFSMSFTRQHVRTMLKYSLPLVPAGLLLLGAQQLPKLILSVFGDFNQVGIFGLAYQVAGFAGLAVLGVQTAITPSILANHHKEETPGNLGKLFETFVIVSLLFCVFLTVFSNELVDFFSSDEYAAAAIYVPFLCFAIALNSMYIFFPGKVIRGKSASQLIASIGSFIVSGLAGYGLAMIDGARGAAIATLLTSASFFIIWYHISQKLYYVPVRWGKIAQIITISIITCVISIFLLPSGFSFGAIALKIGLLTVFALIIASGQLSEWKKKYIAARKIAK